MADPPAPSVSKTAPVPEGFVYASDNNPEWMSDAQLQTWIEANREKIGSI